jgi:hypothetical protein
MHKTPKNCQRRGELVHRYITTANGLIMRQRAAKRALKGFYARLLEKNDERLKRALKQEAQMFAEELIESANRLIRRKEE